MVISSTSLHISTQSSITDELLANLRDMPLDTLRLAGSVLQDTEKSSQLWDAVTGITSFVNVHLLDGIVPAQRVAELLQNCPDMKVLEIGRAQIEGDAAALQDFECSVAEHESLEEFHGMDIDFTMHGRIVHTHIDNLIKSLTLVGTLSVLKIQSSPKHEISCSKFCLAPLLYCKNLTLLHLGHLPMEEGHFAILSYGVAVSTTLHTLALPHTNMNDEGATKVAASCSSNSSVLSSIDLACNNITDKGCGTLATNLALNTNMRSVKLDGNKAITSKGFMALTRMLQDNTNIESLELGIVGKDARVVIDEQLSKNRAEKATPSAMAA